MVKSYTDRKLEKESLKELKKMVENDKGRDPRLAACCHSCYCCFQIFRCTGDVLGCFFKCFK